MQVIIAAPVLLPTAFGVCFPQTKREQAKADAQKETAERYIGETADAMTAAVLHISQNLRRRAEMGV